MFTSSEIINLNNVMSRQARSRWRNLTTWVSRPIIQSKRGIQSKTVTSRSLKLQVHLQKDYESLWLIGCFGNLSIRSVSPRVDSLASGLHAGYWETMGSGHYSRSACKLDTI